MSVDELENSFYTTYTNNNCIYTRFDGFNKQLENMPETTIKLTLLLLSNFNQELTNLPLNLEHLEIICSSYNQPLDCLPSNLKTLIINSREYNQPLDNLPSSLETLTFSRFSKFQQSLKCLPHNLKNVSLYTYYSKKNELKLQYPQLNITYIDW